MRPDDPKGDWILLCLVVLGALAIPLIAIVGGFLAMLAFAAVFFAVVGLLGWFGVVNLKEPAPWC
mgnify:CR=1 FL=1